MTQKDIAKRVGVSVSTVSRVLSNKDTKAASKEINSLGTRTGTVISELSSLGEV